MLQNFGIQLPLAPSQNQNVAAVIVATDCRPSLSKVRKLTSPFLLLVLPKSLRGGTLLQTFLKGLDGQVYAVAFG